MNKMNNDGFSLIEILVSLAIAAVVLVGTYTLMNSSAKSYRQSSSDIDVQAESETTSNFIYELLLEAQDVRVTDAVAGSTGSCKTLVVLNNKYVKDASTGKQNAQPQYNFIVFDDNNEKLYFKKVSALDADGKLIPYSIDVVNSNIADVVDDTKLLAEHVKTFNVSPSRLKAQTPISYEIVIDDGTASPYKSTNSVITRNYIEDESAATPTPAP